ncbi:MAG: metal-dependent hydrolase [Bacteroidetes bacterium]|nr:MAG: metal-dependent hydrolase [Bacteroidota bacterium]
MKLTNYGHACWHIELENAKLLIDPFISPNELAGDINIDTIECDYILITHGHEDHIADVENIAKRTGAKLISNFEIINWFAAKGIENGHPMNIGGKWKFDFGTLTYFTAQHSSVMPDGASGGNPGSFIIETPKETFYHAGDTGLMMDMQLIPKLYKLDFAILPIGDNFTMGVDEAIIASDFIDCNNIIAMHYDTFGYILVEKEAAKLKFESKGKKLKFIDIGTTIDSSSL